MDVRTETLCLESPAETAALARRFGLQLRAGDVILLEGDIGAGKSFFARSLIQSLQDHPEDVPSPTFTLVQTYETARGAVWHADLYRLTSALEVEELGLVDAFEEAICLIEWPDRLADLTPAHALTITFGQGTADDARRLLFRWTDPKWTKTCAEMA